jgi:hypothetical protein
VRQIARERAGIAEAPKMQPAPFQPQTRRHQDHE